MASDPATLESLPNEILVSILSDLPTHVLLPLSVVSRRFHSLVLRLLSQRLHGAASAERSQLILECYHPSAKLSTPYLYCELLGTGPLGGGDPSAVDGTAEGRGSGPGSERSLGELRRLYSRFRPLAQEDDGLERRRRRVGAVSQQQQHEGGGSSNAADSDKAPEPPSLDVHLDEAELFTQLCTVTNLVKTGPRQGLFVSHVNISDGLIRVWRDYLVSAAAAGGSGTGRQRPTDDGTRARFLWADPYEHVGVRFRVVETTDGWRAPLLVGADEDPPVSYRLEYEELIVRTSQLLLRTETSDEHEATSSGKAIVIASI